MCGGDTLASFIKQILTGALITLVSVQCVFATESGSGQDIDKLLRDIWVFQAKTEPVEGAENGVFDFNDKLADRSPEALAKYYEKRKHYLQQLNAMLTDDISMSQKADIVVMQHLLRDKIDKYELKYHYIPLTSEFGFHMEIAFLSKFVRFATAKDYRDYNERLKQVPAFFDQNIYWLKKGIESGFTQPLASIKGSDETIRTFITDDIENSVFMEPYRSAKPVFMSDSEWKTLKSDAMTTIKQSVVPQFERFLSFYINEYEPAARHSVGISAIKGGTEYYENRIKHFTTTDLSGEEIHQLGLSEVARIRAEMDKIIKQTGFKGDFKAFVEFLRTDKQFYAETPKDLLKEASYIAKRVDAKLPQLFKTIPRKPFAIDPVPDELAPKYTTGRYLGSNSDEKPGTYWLNTYALDRRPLYALPALTLHEAVPGHHFQAALSAEQEMLPHRKHYYMSAFGEGWALYAEYLGIEAGIYDDPYSDFGRLTYEMWRACRLVVDTGIHIKGWSRKKAMTFMEDNTALSKHNIQTETDRYITWPAQALSYKIGELTIKRLRKKAENALGNRFNVREFHDRVLMNGSVPMNLLEEIIDQYIADVKASH